MTGRYPAVAHRVGLINSPWLGFPWYRSTPGIGLKEGESESGQMKFPGYFINCNAANTFLNSILFMCNLNTNPEFNGAFFHIYGKDLKLALNSRFEDPFTTFNKFYGIFDDSIETGELMFDIGIELFPSRGNHTLLWNAAKISTYMKSAHLVKRTADRWCYHTDIMGYRGSMNWKKALKSHLIYCQAYVLEKEMTYPKAGGMGAISFSPDDAYRGTSKFHQAVDMLGDIWASSKKNSFGARLEYRVSGVAAKYLVESKFKLADYIKKNEMLFSIPTSTISKWKSMRLNAYYSLINRVTKKGNSIWDLNRRRLVTWLTYLIKALVSRPEDTWAYRELYRDIGAKENQSLTNMPYTKLIDWDALTLNLTQDMRKIDTFSNRNSTSPLRRKRVLANPPFDDNEERKSIDELAQEVFNQFTTDLWNAFPAPTRHLNNVDMSQASFTINFIEEAVKHPHYYGRYRKKGSDWKSKYDTFFNTKSHLSGRGMQNWDRLRYIKNFRACCLALSAPKRVILKNKLWEKFRLLEALPAADPKGKLWQTRKMRGNRFTSVLFIRNYDI